MDPNIEEFAKLHPVGFCKRPKGLASLPSLKATTQFMAPSRIDLRDYCTPTEDQGIKPWCAAYAAAQWTENIKWRLTDVPQNYDPAPIYKYAKSIDGDPGGDGTTLQAVLEWVRRYVFTNPEGKVMTIRPTRLAVKYAVHKYGCILGGFDIDSSWWGVKKDTPIINGKGAANQGGHAVLICGYDKQGVWIQNSWGKSWGEWGFAKVAWEAFDKQFMYGAVLSHALDGMTL